LWQKIDTTPGVCLTMIDSTVYDRKSIKKLESCYSDFNQKVNKAEQVRKQQESFVFNAIEWEKKKNGGKITHFILCIHHPVLCMKKHKPKDEKEDKKKDKEGGDKKKDKELKFELNSDIFDIYPFLSKISESIAGAEFIVLCADLHGYQDAMITINDSKHNFNIQQYIVGTGGTNLDEEVKSDDGTIKLSNNCISNGDNQYVTGLSYQNNSNNIIEFKPPATKEDDDSLITYELNTSLKSHGLLSLIINDDNSLTFEFIKAPARSIMMGGKKYIHKINTRRTKRFYKIKGRKTKRRYPKTR
jgi:hypothetical protein